MLAMKRWLRRPLARARRRARLLRRRRGQIAVAFVVLMGLVLLLTPPLMNLGEVARLKTATANAADAGTLAAASLVASGTNYLARIAQWQLIIFWTVQSLFFVPFCVQAVAIATALVMALSIINRFLKDRSVSAMMNLWGTAQTQALLLPFANVSIDDPEGDAGMQQALQQISDELKADPTKTRRCYTREWERWGLALPFSQSCANARYTFSNPVMPDLVMGGGHLTFWGWIPSMCGFVFWPAWGWNVGDPIDIDIVGDPSIWGTEQYTPGYSGTAWWHWLIPNVMKMGSWGVGGCGYPTCIPFFVPVGALVDVKPVRIANSSGTITVTVERYRESNSQMLFWKMRYPDRPGLVSTAVARYGGAEACGPFRRCDNAVAELVAVDPPPLPTSGCDSTCGG